MQIHIHVYFNIKVRWLLITRLGWNKASVNELNPRCLANPPERRPTPCQLSVSGSRNDAYLNEKA